MYVSSFFFECSEWVGGGAASQAVRVSISRRRRPVRAGASTRPSVCECVCKCEREKRNALNKKNRTK